MNIPKFFFTRDWKNRQDFPVSVNNEEEARSNMQALFDEIKKWINDTLIIELDQIPAPTSTLTKTSVVDALDSNSVDKPLSANKGRVLDELIKAVVAALPGVSIKRIQATGKYPMSFDMGIPLEAAIVVGRGDKEEQAISFVLSPTASLGLTRTIVGKSGVVQNFKMHLDGSKVTIDGASQSPVLNAHNVAGSYETIIGLSSGKAVKA